MFLQLVSFFDHQLQIHINIFKNATKKSKINLCPICGLIKLKRADFLLQVSMHLVSK